MLCRCGSVEDAFREFHHVLKDEEPEKLDKFLTDYEAGSFSSFRNGIQADYDAIRNAITESLNSGFVEGSNNKHKLFKRLGHGRPNQAYPQIDPDI